MKSLQYYFRASIYIIRATPPELPLLRLASFKLSVSLVSESLAGPGWPPHLSWRLLSMNGLLHSFSAPQPFSTSKALAARDFQLQSWSLHYYFRASIYFIRATPPKLPCSLPLLRQQ